MFYSNLYFTNGTIYYEVRKHKISLPLKEFANILDLPHDGPRFKSDKPEECDKYMYKSATSSFLLNPKSCITSPFTIGSVRLNIRLIHYVANHILFPSRSNIGDDVVCNCRWGDISKAYKRRQKGHETTIISSIRSSCESRSF